MKTNHLNIHYFHHWITGFIVKWLLIFNKCQLDHPGPKFQKWREDQSWGGAAPVVFGVGGDRRPWLVVARILTTSSVSSSFCPRVACARKPSLLVVLVQANRWPLLNLYSANATHYTFLTAEQLVTASYTNILYMLVRPGYPESCHNTHSGFTSPLPNQSVNTCLVVK